MYRDQRHRYQSNFLLQTLTYYCWRYLKHETSTHTHTRTRIMQFKVAAFHILIINYTQKYKHFFYLWGCDFWYCGHYWPTDRRWWLWRNWWNEDWQGKPKYSEKTCPSATVHHKSHMAKSGIEPGPPRWEASDWPLELWRGLTQKCKHRTVRVHYTADQHCVHDGPRIRSAPYPPDTKGMKRPKREADHSSPCRADILGIIAAPSIHLHGMMFTKTLDLSDWRFWGRWI
jgi:hypothetical protein